MSYLSVARLEKSFGDFRALNGVSIDIAKGEGAVPVLGGQRASRPECGDGWFVEPTIFTGVKNTMEVPLSIAGGRNAKSHACRDEHRSSAGFGEVGSALHGLPCCSRPLQSVTPRMRRGWRGIGRERWMFR